MSEVTLADIKLREPLWTLRFAVDEQAVYEGGLTLYGSGFGNHNQDIVIRTYLNGKNNCKSAATRSLEDQYSLPDALHDYPV